MVKGMSHELHQQALRPSAGGMVSIKISDEIARLKAKAQLSSVDRLAVSLVKDDALNLLLMVLKKGAWLAEHRTKGPIAVHVLAGAVRFSAGSRSEELFQGTIAALDRDIVHELEALEESVILLITAIER
jgi:quercetin dioxygenase-like cupin family protein